MKSWKKYLISAVVAGVLCFLMLYMHDIKSAVNATQIFKILADGFTLPGVLFLGVGALVWVASTGALDGIAYSLGRAGRMLIPFSKKTDETFYDYKTRKAESRTGGYGFILVTGAVCLAISVVFIVLYYLV